MDKLPFVSVVVISYFGERTLAATIESLLEQTYPHDRYEILVVNDGSTDRTIEIARSYRRVRLVNRPHAGISATRNAGLRVCKGDIYVAFDDDCVASPDWLSELIKGYEADDPVGVGGRISEPEGTKGFTHAYISAGDNNYGVQMATTANSPMHRLLRYVRSRLKTGSGSLPERALVNELYGANSSFPTKVLKKVGGWHDHMSGIEDRDLSLRIRQAYPDRPFFVMPKAVITHRREQTLLQYLLRSYKRGPVNLAFHRKYHLTPPLFPFPIVCAGLLALSLIVNPWLLLPTVVLAPQLLYFWWIAYAFRTRQLRAVLFPYVQLIEESLVLAGLARGYVFLFRHKLRVALSPLRRVPHLFTGFLLISAWAIAVLQSSSSAVHTLVSLPFLLVVPGYFCLMNIQAITKHSSSFRVLSYSIGLSLLVLMVSGLGLNEVYNALGWHSPFEIRPLVYTISSVTAFLAFVAFVRRPREFALFPWRLHRPSQGIALAWAAIMAGLLLPLLAAAGAVTLNNGGPAFIASTVLAAIAVLVLLMVLYARELVRYYGWVLFGICASLLLASSLRGWNITGHDVLQEYQVFQLTLQHAAWHMSYYQDAYMACLSITILPTILQKLTGISDPYIFKLVFQLLFALIAPIMYQTLKAYVSSRRALLATIVFLFFPTFLTDIMMLNRQEIALIFFALSLYAGLDVSLGRRSKSLLGFLFLIGMVLSHYSTSYIALAALAIALLMAFGWATIARSFKRKSDALHGLVQLYRPTVVIASLLVIIVWGSVITQTSTNIYKTLGFIVVAIEQKAGHSSAAAPVQVSSSAAHYAAAAAAARTLPRANYYPARIVDMYPIQETPERTASVTAVAQAFKLPSRILLQFYNNLRSLYALALLGLAALGLLLLLAARKRKIQLPEQYLFLGAALLVLIVAQAALPSTAINYGPTRVLQQALLVLALPIVLAGLWLLRSIRIPIQYRDAILTIVVVGFFVILSGLTPLLTGGYRPVLPLANDGLYYQVYYTHQEEVAAAHWLSTGPPVGSRVYSDEFMRRKVIAYAGIFPQPTLVPAALPVDSYVVLDSGNIVFDQVPAYDGTGVIYYQPPIAFLGANKNLVYTSTNIKVYK